MPGHRDKRGSLSIEDEASPSRSFKRQRTGSDTSREAMPGDEQQTTSEELQNTPMDHQQPHEQTGNAVPPLTICVQQWPTLRSISSNLYPQDQLRLAMANSDHAAEMLTMGKLRNGIRNVAELPCNGSGVVEWRSKWKSVRDKDTFFDRNKCEDEEGPGHARPCSACHTAVCNVSFRHPPVLH